MSIRRGTMLALVAAVLFGVAAPLLKHAGDGVGPFTVAALLYAGAAVVSLPSIRRWGSAGPRGGDLGTLVLVALSGAVAAPVALAWGLARTSAVTASLLLNTEALFTFALAAVAYREHLGRRVIAALLLMAVGGAILVLGATPGGVALSAGAAGVLAATLFWAIDNTLTRRLADRDAGTVVLAKAALGATVSGALAVALGERAPDARAAFAVLACGSAGYGLSLRFYVLAQRTLGAGRTGSIFAVGPFAGAALAPLLGDPRPSAPALVSGALFALGVCLHLTERHAHRHRHEAVEHDHVHRHDDGHHDHTHDPLFRGEHAHPHRHEAVDHEHEHAPDLHHRHGH